MDLGALPDDALTAVACALARLSGGVRGAAARDLAALAGSCRGARRVLCGGTVRAWVGPPPPRPRVAPNVRTYVGHGRLPLLCLELGPRGAAGLQALSTPVGASTPKEG